MKRIIRKVSTNQLKFQNYAGLVSVLSVLSLLAAILGFIPVNWYIVIFMYFIYWCVGISIAYHRYISHRSFEFKNKTLERICVLVGAASGQGDPFVWAAIHKHHHLHSDKKEDPHGPHIGWLSYLLANNYSHIPAKFDKRIKDKLNLFLFKYYTGCILAWWLSLYLIGGIWLLMTVSLVPIGLYMVAVNLTVQMTHMYGYVNFKVDDKARNNWWIAIISFGEGWHNNHHAKPRRYTFQEKWWEFDLGGFIIKHFLAEKVVENNASKLANVGGRAV